MKHTCSNCGHCYGASENCKICVSEWLKNTDIKFDDAKKPGWVWLQNGTVLAIVIVNYLFWGGVMVGVIAVIAKSIYK